MDPATQSRGVGHAIKLHQRGWALDRRIESVHWTFDPLVRRNAYFNLHKLGARAVTYLPDFYGRMTDGINAGDATSDRLYIQWDVASPEAIAAAAGDSREVDFGRCRRRRRGRARPRRDSARPAPAKPVYDGRPLLVAVPEDVETLRGRDPTWPYAWRGEVARRARRRARAPATGSPGWPATGGTSWKPSKPAHEGKSVNLRGLELRRIAMPLVSPFRTSFGTEHRPRRAARARGRPTRPRAGASASRCPSRSTPASTSTAPPR